MAREKRVQISAAQRQRYLEQVDELEDEIEELKDKKERLNGILKDRIKLLTGERWALRRKAKGLDLEQTEVPGTETGDLAPLDRGAAREIAEVLEESKKGRK